MFGRALLIAGLPALLALGVVGAANVTAAPAPAPSNVFVEPPQCPYNGDHRIPPDRRGPAVAHLQCLLSRAWGFDVPIDGVLGPKTAAAVRAFQRLVGLPVDGIVGPQTWLLLHPTPGHG